MGAALCRGATLARRSTTWRRTFPTGSPAISRSWRALERDAGRRAHADRVERAASGVHHRRHPGSVGRSGGRVQGGGRGRAGLSSYSARRISASPTFRRSTRPSSTAISAGTITPAAMRRRRRLEGVPGVPGEVLQVVRPGITQAREDGRSRRSLLVVLVLPQGHDRIDARRPAGRNPAREAGHQHQHARDRAEDDPRRRFRAS